MKTFYYLLRGDNEEIGFGEARALLSIYSGNYRFLNCYTSICIFQHQEQIYEKVIRRSSFIKEAGIVDEIIDLYDADPNYIKNIIGDNTVKVRVIKGTCSVDRIKELLRELFRLKRIYGKTGFYEKVLYCSENKLIIGYNPLSIDSKELDRRKPSLRPFFRSIALKPSIARLLINLARIREGEVLLDPFAGTGSIPIEAGLLGLRYIAVELDEELVRGMKINLEHYGVFNNGLVVHGDSTELSYSVVDGIATDPPYGRSTKTFGSKVIRIYNEFLNLASNYIKKNGFISFLAPLVIEDYVDESIYRNDFILYDKHYLYVHGGLTRVVYEVVKN
uniref:tRNA (guanine(10)-N(2))-dimethyltransferase n=1 Tax=Staphylothermus marinus TaxID=2280 RepID=A0A7C4JMD8_STAMA